MKTRILSLLLAAILLSIAAPKPAHAYVGVGAGVSVGAFYGELSPYGRWVSCPYGYAWVPTVAVGWQPYADGEWAWTDYGWAWVSYDPWPDDPFHYGSWYWDAGFGWAWVPGFVWAPSWVTWCYGDGFVGWAPLPPTFAFATRGYDGRPVVAARAGYVFVPGNRFAGARVASVRMPASRNAALLARGRSVTSFGVTGGVVTNRALPVSRVEAAMRETVPVRAISVARTDPRPIPRATGGRLALTARPAVLKAEIDRSRNPLAPRVASPATGRNRSRIVITNRGGGPVRATGLPTSGRGRRTPRTAIPRPTVGTARYAAPAGRRFVRPESARTQLRSPQTARASAPPLPPHSAAPQGRRRPTPPQRRPT